MAKVDTTSGTYLSNLFDPEVIGDMINSKLFDAIKLAPLATVHNELSGQPGSKVKLPFYTSIGLADVVAEGEDIPISQLREQTKEVEIHKIGKGIQLTDESVLSAYGDPLGQGISQIVASIAGRVDSDLYTELDKATLKFGTATDNFSADLVADALTAFGEDIDGQKALLVSPEQYAVLRKAQGWVPNTEVAAGIVISGTVGYIHGCQVVVANKVADGKAYIVKPGALAIYSKRETLVETDRDIINKSTVVTADKHFATFLQDESKAIAITCKPLKA